MAESFGSDAERYDRTRPRYPQAMIARIVDASPGRDILDVGCGTGIDARQFQAAGCSVLGVEPDGRMAEFARGTGVEVDVARFEEWEPAGRTFDAVVAGTSWHWIDQGAGGVKAAKVLRPGGRLAAFWHAFELPPTVADAFGEVYRRVVPDSPFSFSATRQGLAAYQGPLVRAADGIRQAGGFGEPEQWRFDWQHTYSREEWLNQLPTHGTLAYLPADKKREVLGGVGEAIDAIGGSFTVSYSTVAVTAARTASP